MGTALSSTTPPPPAELRAGPRWRRIEFLSDLHLQPDDRENVLAWRDYMRSTQADAVFILGDLFEAWVGDDAALEPGFEADCAEVLAAAGARLALHVMHGNRDFLVGRTLADQCRCTLIEDPTVLDFAGERWLLTHGDMLCLDDADYVVFRAKVRAAPWQRDFLEQPLEKRRALAAQMRVDSAARKAPAMEFGKVDEPAARAWLESARARTMIHGHTHLPADHDLGTGLKRIVLSDWDSAARPPRREILRLEARGLMRIALP